MIDTHKPREVHPNENVSQRNSGVMFAGLAGLVGAVLITLGMYGFGQQTSPTLTSQAISSPSTESTMGAAPVVTSVTEPEVADPSTEGDFVLTDVSEVVAGVIDSVVTIESIGQFRGRQLVMETGSGVVVAQGTIVTNAHVVESADGVVVVLADGTEYAGTVIDGHAQHDLAVIEIDAENLQSVELGSTSQLTVGDGVIAVGYPLDIEGSPSVSTGIVSALNRTLEEGDVWLSGVIQTDAAITEGSSGGALFDGSGRLIGITTAVGVSSVGLEGIGFAIPVETVVGLLASPSSSSVPSP